MFSDQTLGLIAALISPSFLFAPGAGLSSSPPLLLREIIARFFLSVLFFIHELCLCAFGFKMNRTGYLPKKKQRRKERKKKIKKKTPLSGRKEARREDARGSPARSLLQCLSAVLVPKVDI